MFDLTGQSEVIKKKDKRSFSPFPEFSPSQDVGPRIDLLPRLRAQQQQQQQRQPVPQPSQPIPIAPSSSTWDKIKAFDVKGLGNELINVGLPHGLSQKGTAKEERYMANAFANKPGPLQSYYQNQLVNQQKDQEYLNANPVNSLPAQIGEQLTQIPLWMAGEAGLGLAGKWLGGKLPSLLPIAEKVGSKLPGIVKGGLMDAGTYGGLVAPVENVQQGGDWKSLLEKEKQLPSVFLGGTLARGAFKGIGEGTRLAKDVVGEGGSLKQALAFRKINTPPELQSNPLQDVQNAYRNPVSFRDVQGQNLNNTFADTTNNLGQTGSTLPKQGMTSAELLQQKELDAQGVFGGPLKGYNKSTDIQDNISELTKKMTNQANDVTKTLRQMDKDTPVETTRSKIQKMGGIKQGNADIFTEQKAIPNWIRNDRTGQSLDKVADELGMSTDELLSTISSENFKPKNYANEAFKVLAKDPEYQANSKLLDTLKGQLPGKRTIDIAKSDIKLKPRELTPLPQAEQPNFGLRPTPPEPLTWTNRDNIPSVGPAPIRSITEQNLGQLAKSGLNPPFKSPNPIGEGRIAPAIVPDAVGNVPIGEGKVIPVITPNTVVDAPIGKVVGAEPIIPAGLKERGVSENIRTDANRPDALRDSYSADPLVYKQLGNKETLAKAQSIFDQGLEPAITQLDYLLKKMQPESAPLVKMIADKLTVEGNIVRARELMSNAALKATESGQFGQAFRILRDADPETFLMTFDKQLGKLNKEGLDKYGKSWKTIDLTPDELTLVSNIERGNQASYDSAFEQIQARIANEMPATAWEKIVAWRHISMLLNPKTQIRNVVGNGIMMGMRRTAKQVSAVLQKVLLPAEERTQVFKIKSEYLQAATDSFEANKKDLLSGANKYNEGVGLNMPNKRVFQNKALESTRKLTYKTLEMGDTPFYKNAYINRLASYAQAKGVKDFSKLGQEAFDVAKKEAEQATYKDASELASFLNRWKNPGPNAGLGKNVRAGFTDAALPFTKTPINIISRGVQYSPAGILDGMYKWKSLGSATAGIDQMAKGLTGTAILGLGYKLASKGILTGKASSDKDLRAYNSNTGNSPFSILGKFTYDWAQPFAVPLSVGVEIYNAIKDNPQDVAKMDSLIAKNDSSRLWEMGVTAANGIMEGLNASGDTVFNMSIMKGIKTLLGSGYSGFMEGLAQLPQDFASQFIPTMVSQIAGTIDPLVRSAYVPGNLPASFKNTLISKIPFASKTLQPKQTPYGEDTKKIENPLGRAFSQFLSPGIIAKVQGSVSPKIDTELRRLNESGLVNQFPTMVPNYIEKTQSHPKISLSPSETTQYQQRVGQLTLSSFGEVMSSDSYLKTNDDTTKAGLLAKAISDAKALAKEEILKSKGIDTAKAKVYSPFSKSTDNTSTDSPFASQKKNKNSTSPFK